jgi:hypothetical protein
MSRSISASVAGLFTAVIRLYENAFGRADLACPRTTPRLTILQYGLSEASPAARSFLSIADTGSTSLAASIRTPAGTSFSLHGILIFGPIVDTAPYFSKSLPTISLYACSPQSLFNDGGTSFPANIHCVNRGIRIILIMLFMDQILLGRALAWPLCLYTVSNTLLFALQWSRWYREPQL